MVIKKIIHISDLHIRNYKMHDQYKEVFKLFIGELKKISAEYEYGELKLVITGDLFHQKITVSNEQFVLGYNFLSECVKYTPIVIIAGNHDLLENNKDRLDSITPIIDTINSPNIKYLKKSECYLDNNIVWCTYSIFENNKQPKINESRILYGDDKTYIGLFHGPVLGAKTDTGHEMKHGVNLSYFKGCDMVLLGDIHQRQEFNLDGINMAFSSSLIQQNYGETIDNHGYLIWDVKNKTFTKHNLKSSYGFFKFKIDSLEDIENQNEKLLNE